MSREIVSAVGSPPSASRYLSVKARRNASIPSAAAVCRVMRLWGAERFSKLVYAAKKIYDAHREDLERERTDEEFMAMYEQYEAFDELEEEFGEMEEEVTETLARYVDGHPELFATIVG